ncbi:MAG: hypothetical protein M3018_00435 [Actinomycetota bacterium]|nr:hypothetical protein [Actinomycetota bacterium]
MSNPSVPRYEPDPPRTLREEERTALLAIADILIPAARALPRASAVPDYVSWLHRALAARSDAFDDVIDTVARLQRIEPSALPAALSQLSETEPASFQALSAVLAGAYLMVPEVRRAINYPGQEARPAPFDEAAEQIMSGILDPVIERGPIYVETGELGTGPTGPTSS